MNERLEILSNEDGNTVERAVRRSDYSDHSQSSIFFRDSDRIKCKITKRTHFRLDERASQLTQGLRRDQSLATSRTPENGTKFD